MKPNCNCLNQMISSIRKHTVVDRFIQWKPIWNPTTTAKTVLCPPCNWQQITSQHCVNCLHLCCQVQHVITNVVPCKCKYKHHNWLVKIFPQWGPNDFNFLLTITMQNKLEYPCDITDTKLKIYIRHKHKVINIQFCNSNFLESCGYFIERITYWVACIILIWHTSDYVKGHLLFISPWHMTCLTTAKLQDYLGWF